MKNGESRLNINDFVEKQVINKSAEIAELKITVNERFIYSNYETYSITLENLTDKTILLGNGNNGNDICLVDNNDTEYDSYINEVALDDLQIRPHSNKVLQIRFNKMCSDYRVVEK